MEPMGSRGGVVMACLLLALLAGCGRQETASGPVYGTAPVDSTTPHYILAVHPLHNPSKLAQVYQPLIDHINRRIGTARFELEASRDYGEYEKKFRTRAPHFLLPNPWQTLEAIKVGYSVIAMAGEPQDFKGIFIVRRDSGLLRPVDLKGKAVSYPAPTALAACIMPQYFLHTKGVDVNRDIENRYVGSQESSIMNAYLGQVAAAATWPPPWRAFQKDHPHEAKQLKVIWETSSLVNNSIMARDDVPAAVRDRIRDILVHLHETDSGRTILTQMETARFRPAADADYDVVRRFIDQFEAEVRPVEK